MDRKLDNPGILQAGRPAPGHERGTVYNSAPSPNSVRREPRFTRQDGVPIHAMPTPAGPGTHPSTHSQQAAPQAPELGSNLRAHPLPHTHRPAQPARSNQMSNAPRLDFSDNLRDEKVFQRAQRYTDKVKILRVALPVIGVLITIGLIASYLYSQLGAPEINVQQANIENGRLVMENPTLDGVDDQQRPYKLSAEQAIQDPTSPQQVELEKILANVPLPDGLFANIKAQSGFYDGDAKTLKLGGTIEVLTDDGLSASLTGADIDMDAGSLKTDNPVRFNAQQAVISADSMQVSGNGDRIIFDKKVRMTIYPDKLQTELNQQKSSGGESQ